MAAITEISQIIADVGAIILEDKLGIEAVSMDNDVSDNKLKSEHITIILQVIGDIEGQIICNINRLTCLNLIEQMCGRTNVTLFDDKGWRVLHEFGRLFGQGICKKFKEYGLSVYVTKPLINEGSHMIHSYTGFIMVPLLCSCGFIDVYFTQHHREEYAECQ
ncbi:hypothetical protein BVG16_10730 [Paenibacillus selenitireducens]|uniref:Uncharacterized protein n=1 Tax=Paenibacillus selenitireducens TaxID=1324314 RepID=A0A1T2XEP2_9BACL|nr:hypothetical protein [Paenibacillus selenitireducens]OPA78351.1 hypothetical protein BVG16_10730 [Paenibacillus selenitireducens]